MPRKPQEKSSHLFEAIRMELKALRLAKKWTQYDLSDFSGYTQAYLNRLEQGVQRPSIQALFDLCDTFGKSPDVFMKAVVKRTTLPPPPKKSNK